MYEFLDYRACDVMTSAPITVGETTSLAEAEAIFAAHAFNTLPVVGPAHELLGVVSKLDLLKAFRFTGRALFPPYEQIMARPVADVMTRDVETVTPRMPLTRVLERLVALRTKCLPVLVGRELVGVIAREDVLRGLQRALAGERATGPI